MPAHRLDNHPVAVRRNEVVGQDSETVPHFIRHVGLAADEHPGLTLAEPLRMTDMGPPLTRRRDPDAVHAWGHVPLTDDEVAQIDLFVDRVASEYQASQASPRRQYVVAPHCAPVTAEDGTITCHRFSCGGFVIEAYRFVGIDLIVTDGDSLPTVGMDVLRLAYPDQQRALDNSRLRETLGLSGDGPWPIVLAGYLLHSLARPEAEIRDGPYQPRPGDEYYPICPPQPPPVSDDAAT